MNELSLAPGLLLSMPHLADPNFTRSVVLMIEHNDEGSFGLIVNQESEIPVAQLLSSIDIEWSGTEDAQVFSGGPVMPSSGWVLHEVGDDVELTSDLQAGLEVGASVLAAPSIALSSSPERLREIAKAPPSRTRFLLGYAGWGPGQLAQEMAQGSWLHAPATRELVFDTPADSMWSQALESIGVDPKTLVPTHGVH